LNHISICICTYKRPQLLQRLLNELNGQVTNGQFNFSIVVADNDSKQSAKAIVTEVAERSLIPITYCVEPTQNIALVRNKALENAQGDFIAFIDDDEYPIKTWLVSLFNTCSVYGADGILGPVKPYFEQEPPKWATKGRFFERPTHGTGYRIGLSEARTGNVMFRAGILDGVEEAFHPKFGLGGEDVDFFRRMMNNGYVFVWCNDAVVYEAVPPARCKRSYLLRRALLRGGNSFRQQTNRSKNLFKSLTAITIYSLALPLLFLAGDHLFMKYLIKLCDHSGRLLAFLGLYPVTQRDP
jgi:succinoglycan biosynthesis protein ExoM